MTSNRIEWEAPWTYLRIITDLSATWQRLSSDLSATPNCH